MNGAPPNWTPKEIRLLLLEILLVANGLFLGWIAWSRRADTTVRSDPPPNPARVKEVLAGMRAVAGAAPAGEKDRPRFRGDEVTIQIGAAGGGPAETAPPQTRLPVRAPRKTEAVVIPLEGSPSGAKKSEEIVIPIKGPGSPEPESAPEDWPKEPPEADW